MGEIGKGWGSKGSSAEVRKSFISFFSYFISGGP